MNKRFNRAMVITAASTWILANSGSVLAGEAATQSEIDELKAKVQMLIQQNQELNTRLSGMEQKNLHASTTKAAIEEEVSRQMEAKNSGPQVSDFVSLSGSIEGDYKLFQGKGGANKSEFILDTVELILDLQVADWATGKIVIDYDGDDDDRFYLDEANITLGKTENIPFFITTGKIYVPFGDFSTNMIQDPLPQTLGEINPKGVIIGYEANGLTATVFSYNGLDEGDENNDTINGFGASLAYDYEQEDIGFNAGIAWVTNIGDSSTLTDVINDNGFNSVIDVVPGISVNVGGSYKSVSLIAEYIAAMDSFDALEVAYDAGGAEPKALSTELAYTTALMDKDTVFAIGYQRSWEAYALDLPEHRYIAAASMNVARGTSVTLEYYNDKFYDNDPDASQNSGYGFTTRLMYEF
ncbi:MAG: LbtU family siderophore porin [Desulfobulbus sp.]